MDSVSKTLIRCSVNLSDFGTNRLDINNYIMGISSFLRTFKGKSLFLPAHGRGLALPSELKKIMRMRPGSWDLPEIPDFGGPLISEGVVAESQRISALENGVDHCWYGVNGATGLLQAAILSIAKPGSGLLMPRNIHRSVIQACVLGDITPVLFNLPFSPDLGHFLPPDYLWMKNIFDSIPADYPEISAALLVNPTYQGYSSEIINLVELIHTRGLPVIVDESHGAHFLAGLEDLPVSALKTGADLVVHSLHKSASALSQAAVLWLQGDKVDPVCVERSIGLVQTTSPNSLLLASCETSLRDLISSSGKRELKMRTSFAKESFYNLPRNGLPIVETQDPLRLLLHTAKKGLSGFQVDEWMISKGLFAELPEPACLTFCLGLASSNSLIRVLQRNWNEFISLFPNREPLGPFLSPPFSLINKPNTSCFSAFFGKTKLIPIQECIGETSADLICPYPPGIPLVIPGEIFEKNHVNWLLSQKELWPDQIPYEVKVVI